MVPVLTAALRTCRPKALKKGYANDKVTGDELVAFENCLTKYFAISPYAESGTKEGAKFY